MTLTGPTAPAPFCLLMKDDGTAETVELGAERCLCVFSDPALVAAFYRGRYGSDFATRDVTTLSFDGPDALRGFLRANEAGLAAQGVRHLAVDPGPDRSVSRVPVRAFIEAAAAPG